MWHFGVASPPIGKCQLFAYVKRLCKIEALSLYHHLLTISSMWSLYLGRPLHTYSKAVSVEKPISFVSEREQKCWRPYGSERPSADPLIQSVPNRQEVVVEHWIQLFEIMSELEGSL